MGIIIRPGTRADWPWLLSRFAIDYHLAPMARGVPIRILGAKLEVLLESPTWRLTVCVHQDEPTEILGALLCRQATAPDYMQRAAWVEVKERWRRRGVATALLTDAGIKPGEVHCAFLPPEVAKMAEGRGYRLRFRPYLPDVELWERAKAEVGRAGQA